MRLSLSTAVALLFGSVLATNPAPVDPKDHPLDSKGTQRDRSGSQSSDSTDGGFDLTKENRGWGSLQGIHFDPRVSEGGLSKTQFKKLSRVRHPVLCLGSPPWNLSKVCYTPLSHNFRSNPSITSEKSANYVTGDNLDSTSNIHTGEPKVTDLTNVRMFPPDQKDFQISKHHRNALLRQMKKNMGQTSLGDRRGDSPPVGYHSEPTDSFSRGRDPTDHGGRGLSSRSRSPVGPNDSYHQHTYRQRTGGISPPPPPRSGQSLPPWRQPAAAPPPPPQSGKSLPPWRQPASAPPPPPQSGQSLPPWRQPAAAPPPPPQSGQLLPPWRQPAPAPPPPPQRYSQSLPPWRQPKDANRRFDGY